MHLAGGEVDPRLGPAEPEDAEDVARRQPVRTRPGGAAAAAGTRASSTSSSDRQGR